MAAELSPLPEQVVLVDANDHEVGIAAKLDAHANGGRLHRAFSVFLYDSDGRMLLQQRAGSKYHFAMLWTNACCGHPRPGEDVTTAAYRRVLEELGTEVRIERAFGFVYSADDPRSGLTEREYDHVFHGVALGHPRPDPGEVHAIAWWEPDALRRDVARHPDRYTPWFRRALPELDAHRAGGPRS